MGRRRTESFHFSNFGDESPEANDKSTSSSILKLKRTKPAPGTKNEFSGYKMTQDPTPVPQKSDFKSFNFDSPTKKVDKAKHDTPIMKKRKRTRSSIVGPECTAITGQSEEPDTLQKSDSFGQENSPPDCLMKGGGYKMSINSISEITEEDKTPSSSNDSEDYFG